MQGVSLLSRKLGIPGNFPASSRGSAETCFLARLNALDSNAYPVVLASTAFDSSLSSEPSVRNHARHDIVLAYPQYSVLKPGSGEIEIVPGSGAQMANAVIPTIDEIAPASRRSFLDVLDSLYRKQCIPPDPARKAGNALPFTGGWFVYLSYEMAGEVEACLDLPESRDLPSAVAQRYVCAMVQDKLTGEVYAVAEPGYEALLDQLAHDYNSLQSGHSLKSAQRHSNQVSISDLREADPEPYLGQVERIREYILEGDIFQANLSRLWQAELTEQASDADLFYCLAQHNPSSFAALASLPGLSIISSSPERLVRCQNGLVETRPIAGTRPRHPDPVQDRQLAEELIAHPKERAEHIMLIDLERNDLGRVCRAGSVEVDELMVVETWQHVHHIVSNVRGMLQADKTPVDVLRAVFPGGTITGCPKVRCMEILAELEQAPRDAYTGSLGYINLDGSMDFNILIRSLVRHGDKISFRAGGGIVSDSVASSELEETRAKAKGMSAIFSSVNCMQTQPANTSGKH